MARLQRELGEAAHVKVAREMTHTDGMGGPRSDSKETKDAYERGKKQGRFAHTTSFGFNREGTRI